MQRGLGQRGAVVPLVAICLTVLIGFAGMAVDVGYWEYHERQQQNATDAAALGGAQQLVYSNCTNSSAARTAALRDSSSNGFANAGNVTVSFQNPPSSGPFAGNNCAVSVQVTALKVGTFFSRLFGFAGGMTESTQAVAVASANANGCIYMLAAGQNTNFQGANITAPQCSILMNGSANFNGGTVDAAKIGEVDAAGSNNDGTFAEATPAAMLPVADPCPEIAGCEYLTTNPPSTSPCTGTYMGTGVLSPGCYNNLSLNGATVALSPGLYVLAGSSNMNKAAITANNVTLYIPAGASTNFNKVSSFTITPPTTGNYVGVSYYQVPSNSTDVNFNGSSTNISGLIYAPTAAMNYNGSYGQYAILVAAYANLNNSTGEDFASPPPNGSLLMNAVLSQ
jgi:Flp pilus assembly protein TadG